MMISFVFYYFCERKPYLCTLFTCSLYIYIICIGVTFTFKKRVAFWQCHLIGKISINKKNDED